jgi:CHAT domain-containing protein
MKRIFAIALLMLPRLTFGQNADSLTAVRMVDSLIQLNVNATEQRKFEEALKSIEAAERKAEEVFGQNHLLYGLCLFNHGRTFFMQQGYSDAEPYFWQAKDIQEKTIGKEHPDYAWTLRFLGVICQYQGKYEKAEVLYLEAKSIFEKTTGKVNLRYAACLSSLGALYNDLGQYEQAISILKGSLEIYEQVPNSERSYAMALNNLGITYWRIGLYEECEATHLKAQKIKATAFGAEHPSYAMTLSNLAILYNQLGQHDRAMQLNLEVKSIREKTLGKENMDYAMTLNNLANDYEELGEYEKAEALDLEAKAIRERMVGKEHADYTMSLNNLANLYRNLGRYAEAEKLDQEALSIRGATLGKAHPDYAYSLTGLGKTYEKMGLYEKAESSFKEAKDIREKALGRENAEYLKSLYNLADFYRAAAAPEKAKSFFLEINEQEQRSISKGADFLHESELVQYINSYRKSQQSFFSFMFDNAQASPIFLRAAWDNMMFFKGLLQENSAAIERAVATAPDSIQQVHARWRGLRRRLAFKYAQPIAERQNVAELEREADALEKELVRSIAGFSDRRRQATWQDVHDKLKPDEAALEFIHFQYCDSEKKLTDTILYVALLIHPSWESPRWVTLFEEKSLDSLLQTSGQRKADYIDKLYSVESRGVVEKGQSLYDILWQPIEKELVGIKTIYYSAVGLVHRLNLGAVLINADSTLADKFQLIQLGSTRQLVIPAERKSSNNEALLFGGIRYELDSAAIRHIDSTREVTAAIATTTNKKDSNPAKIRSLAQSESWRYLLYTDKEVVAIEEIMKSAKLQTQLFNGYSASEEAFKRIGANGKNSPRILHIATHGFFFSDQKDTTNRNHDPVFKVSENPMIRSGLLFAGANHAWTTGKPLRKDMDDGILTAYEISQMNLSNTELVVLSACETGLGDIKGNEGVFGLQRAFKIAGVKYLIMSLWQVPDKQTSILMVTFYKKWLEDKMEIPEAFRAAQKQMREQGLDPYYWAGFVLVE